MKIPWLLFCFLAGHIALAQSGQASRIRSLNRVDLEEKQNRPLLGSSGSGQSMTGKGLIQALMAGLEQGRYPAYDPDKPGKTMSWPVVRARLAALNHSETATAASSNNYVAEFEGVEPPEPRNAASPAPKTDLAPCEHVFQFVADEIFDPVRSTTSLKIRYLEIIWVDPEHVLPERKVCAFKYEEVVTILEQATWVDPRNEAETRTLTEAFDLRLFRSYPIQVSGQPVQTLHESQQKSSQLIQYEHNLWGN